jgi:DNA-directed RNA polymerase II subunit RPB1
METNKNTYAHIVDTVESITRIDFSIYSNPDVLGDSAIADPNGITVAEIYNNNEPVQGGAIDKRLGVTDKQDCGTCGETALKCPGHFGHIRFVEPVFHMGYLSFLKNILSCVCIRCNKLLVYKNEEEIAKLLKNKQGKQRFNEIRSICKGVTHCQKENYGCGTPAHKITIDKKYGNVFLLAEAVKKNGETDEAGETKKRAPQILTPQLCYDILKAVSDEDCMIMGFDPEKSRPEDMIIVNFPVPPVQVRPSIKMEILSSSTIDDDLTHKLVDIIKNNETLKNTKGDGSLVKSASVNDDFMLLQFHVATFFANDILGLPRSQQKNKKITKSLSERLKGKEGRVRGNLMGKRVDMSGRTVITSDPNIALNEVGIPLIIAKNLTYPEIVTKYNISYLKQLVKNGRRIYPGANFVIKNIVDNEGNEAKHVYHLKHAVKPVPLKPGDIVERHLINGDIVLFNRQPSLHKLSMMGHKCHVINDPSLLTFRVNVSVTDPYNADWC